MSESNLTIFYSISLLELKKIITQTKFYEHIFSSDSINTVAKLNVDILDQIFAKKKLSEKILQYL